MSAADIHRKINQIILTNERDRLSQAVINRMVQRQRSLVLRTSPQTSIEDKSSLAIMLYARHADEEKLQDSSKVATSKNIEAAAQETLGNWRQSTCRTGHH